MAKHDTGPNCYGRVTSGPLTVDRVAEDDGLVHLQLREECIEAVHLLTLRYEGVELGNTLKERGRNGKTREVSSR